MKIFPQLIHSHCSFVAFFLIFFTNSLTEAQDADSPADNFKGLIIEKFLDSLLAEKLESYNVVGCGILIVKDSSIILSKGYGYSDEENQVPFYPDKTLFRLASVCKVVTGTVLLQAKEKGLIDFNGDINNYLKKFKIEFKFDKPVTIEHLLTHTPGFDDAYIGKSSRIKEEAIPFGEFIREFFPEQVMPPGEIYTYSNMGVALAAFIVQEITGMDFEKYAVENLFKPLEMNTSSFTLQEFQKENLTKGYVQIDGENIEFPFDHINDYPAGQMLTTLNEFGNFMIMQLNEGRFNGKQVMKSESIKEMQSTHFTHHSRLHGSMGYTFGIGELFGTKLLGHDGGYSGIETRLWLFPDIKVGLFISSNTPSGGFLNDVSYTLMNRFYKYEKSEPKQKFPLTDLPEFDKRIERFTGHYRYTRYTRNSITKMGLLMGFMGEEMPVWQNDEGMIMIYDHNRKERRMIQVEPLLFQSVDDNYFMAFRENEEGNITHVFTSGTSALEKTPWYYTISSQRILFLLVTTILALFFSVGLVTFITRNEKDITLSLIKLMVLISGLFLLYLVLAGLAIFVFASPMERNIGFPYGMPWYFYLFQTVPLVAIAALAWLVIKLAKGIITHSVKVPFFVSALFFILICAVNIWFMDYWQILGYRF